MKCTEVHDKLNDLVDLEVGAPERLALQRHLERCPSCSDAHAELLALKRLVQTKTTRPAVPADLRRRVESRCGDGGGTSRFSPSALRLAAAVLVLASIAGAIVLFSGIGTSRLGHAAASRGCLEAFEERLARESTAGETGAVPTLESEPLMREIARALGRESVQLPRIAKADFLDWEPQSVRGVRGVRLDFRAAGEEGDTARSRLISVFLLPMEALALSKPYLDELDGLHCCSGCLSLAQGSVFCFRRDDLLVNVVSDLDPATIGPLLAAR